jgi:hypothetical protein
LIDPNKGRPSAVRRIPMHRDDGDAAEEQPINDVRHGLDVGDDDAQADGALLGNLLDELDLLGR